MTLHIMVQYGSYIHVFLTGMQRRAHTHIGENTGATDVYVEHRGLLISPVGHLPTFAMRGCNLRVPIENSCNQLQNQMIQT